MLTSQEAAELAAKSHAPGNARNNSALRQALELQLALHDAGLAMSKDVSTCEDKGERARAASALAGVSKGWQGLQDCVRILKGEPLPGSLRPASKPERKRKADSVAPLSDEDSRLKMEDVPSHLPSSNSHLPSPPKESLS